MNLGSMKDKTLRTAAHKAQTRKIVAAACVCCLALAAVTTAIALTNRQPVNGLAEATPTAATQAENVRTTPAPTKKAEAQATAEAAKNTPAPTDSQSVSGPVTVEKETMTAPIAGADVMKRFADDQLVYSATLKHWSTHEALDLAAEEGTPVLAALDGKVKSIAEDDLLGLTVTIEHENCKTVYACLAGVAEGLTEGSTVLRGQAIGKVGTSAQSEAADGAHLHFAVTENGKAVNPQALLGDAVK